MSVLKFLLASFSVLILANCTSYQPEEFLDDEVVTKTVRKQNSSRKSNNKKSSTKIQPEIIKQKSTARWYYIGEVAWVNKQDNFVLIKPSSKNIQINIGEVMYSYTIPSGVSASKIYSPPLDKGTSILKMTPDRNGDFMTADIQTGVPSLADSIYIKRKPTTKSKTNKANNQTKNSKTNSLPKVERKKIPKYKNKLDNKIEEELDNFDNDVIQQGFIIDKPKDEKIALDKKEDSNVPKNVSDNVKNAGLEKGIEGSLSSDPKVIYDVGD